MIDSQWSDSSRTDHVMIWPMPFIFPNRGKFSKIANEAKLVRGNLVYLYAGLRTLVAWKDATFEVSIDGERHPMRGYGVAVANSKAYGGGTRPVLRTLTAIDSHSLGGHARDHRSAVGWTSRSEWRAASA